MVLLGGQNWKCSVVCESVKKNQNKVKKSGNFYIKNILKIQFYSVGVTQKLITVNHKIFTNIYISIFHTL